MIINIAITGASGFIGAHFIKNCNKDFSILQIDLIKQDIGEINLIGIDSVLHLAAMVHQMKEIREERYFEVNCAMAYNVAKYAKEQGVKQFVLMSTSKVYGESTKQDNYWNEDSECNPTDPYGKSKLEAERLIRGLEDETFKVAIIRSPLVYGPGVKANMHNLVKLVDNVPIIPLGGLDNKRSVVYIGNLIALLKVIMSKQHSGIFIAGDRIPLSTSKLVEYISLGLEKKPIFIKLPKLLLNIVRGIKPAFVDRLFGSLVLDNSVTNNSLAFIPPYSTEDGINEMVKWYKCNKGKKEMISTLRNIKRKLEILTGRINSIRNEIEINHEWYGNKYGGFYVHPDSLNTDSIVYSFGIGEDISFDKEIIEKHHCQVFGFDPTPKSIIWIRNQQLPTNFTFLDYGIDSNTGFVNFNLPKNENHVSGSIISHQNVDENNSVSVPMKCFADITNELGHKHIDLLKMDIEGTEFEIIDSILSSSIEINQILIELHERFFVDGRYKTNKLLKSLKDSEYKVFAVSESYEEVSFIKVKENKS